MEKNGYIYVLTNESFHRENWIKIGYAVDVDKRVRELSNTSVPLPYQVYCTYEIPRIDGVKDPDKLIHDLIQNLNPNLRISPNREFFTLLPIEAYNMLHAIAQMHGRLDKLVKNADNHSDEMENDETDYAFEALYPKDSVEKMLFDKFSKLILSIDSSLETSVRANYVSFKKGKRNAVSVWPKSGWLELVLNSKIGQIKDEDNLIYDISNRKWTSAQYALKYYDDTDEDAVKRIVKQIIELKVSEMENNQKKNTH